MAYTIKNKVQLIGTIGCIPDVTVSEENIKKAVFTVVTDEKVMSEKGVLELVTLTYVKKGGELAVEGKLVNGTFIDPKGKKVYITEVHASDLLMLGKAPQ
jgi:single-strand DNA-binding protein